MANRNETSKAGIGITLFFLGIIGLFISKLLVEYLIPTLDILYVFILSVIITIGIIYLIIRDINIYV